MSIHFDEQSRVFTLSTDNTSMVFSVFEKGYLFSQYYGKKIRTADLSHLWQPSASGFTPLWDGASRNVYSLHTYPQEYPVYGGGDYHTPAIEVEFPDGSRNIDLAYQSHTITKGNAELSGLPSLSGGDETLEITLKDEFSGLEVILRYVVFSKIDIITRAVRIVNATDSAVKIHRALSANINLMDRKLDFISLYGDHNMERKIHRTPLHHGIQSVGSLRGTSSHQQNPFVMLAAPSADEFQGNAYAMALIYSGNFIANAEYDERDMARLQIGIHPDGFSWKLEGGEEFITPEAVLSYTDKGFNHLSQHFHDAIRHHLGHSKFRNAPRPIVINNWEATYMDFNEQKLLDLIDSCKGLGIDTFVLDDGWFGHRDDDHSSLGDWFVYKNKLPGGLDAIIDKCESLGMSFGLWFEPEMISEDSELYKAHPDWCLRVPNRAFCRGRTQLVLDMTRDEVVEYLQKTVGDILRNNRISYVKWDMNRHLTDVYSTALPADRQGEVFHRYVLNLYKFMGYLVKEFPHVLFEGCSGGGGRFDMGILYYHPQIWTSDDSDAIERLEIQYGTSLCYPPQAMTAHVSACPNHQVHRTTPFATRGAVAMSGIFGYELNPLELSDTEREAIAAQTALYHKIQPLVMNGTFYRLVNPFESDACAWMTVSDSKDEAIVTYTQKLTHPRWRRHLKLTGLNETATYRVEIMGKGEMGVFGGDVLQYAGLTMPFHKDFEATMLYLHKI